MVKSVLFDMDGLLVDTERVARTAWKYAGEKCGVVVTDNFYATLIGIGRDDSEKALLQQFGPDFPLDRFKDQRYNKMRNLLHGAELLKKGAAEILRFIHSRDIPMGLVTSSHHEDVDDRLGSLTRYFSVVVAREDVAHGKPAPDLYQAALEKMEIGPDESIVLEDSPVGMEAARRAGLDVILVPDLISPGPDISEKAFAVCDDLFKAIELLGPILDTKY
ncbi:MAG TPA: HAD family phosphatase [Balneolales bacterium]|nr:HAD family phosphatase [Balneolales bacterium]